jgi:hypothetical protein
MEAKKTTAMAALWRMGWCALAGMAVWAGRCEAQTGVKAPKLEEVKFLLNEGGTRFVRLSMINQVWFRYTETNPGTTISNPVGPEKAETVPHLFDVGLRRTRVQIISQPHERVLFYVHLGINNFNFISSRKPGAFFHDATGEYELWKDKLWLGGGLHGWVGPARFAAPATGVIMALDAPLFEQATNDVTDQFLRRFGIYAHGYLGRVGYRTSVNQPMFPIAFNQSREVGTAYFSNAVPKLQYHGYAAYHFRDREVYTLPYTFGTYLGKKTVLNVGAGWIFQSDAMEHLDREGQVRRTPMRQLAVDLIWDTPVDSVRMDAFHVYAAWFNFDFGPNFVRNLGVMNPANGGGGFNGPGNAFPIVGTGNVVYAQSGYKFKEDWLGDAGTLMPYVSGQVGFFDRLDDPSAVFDVGVQWLILGHHVKLCLDYQNRPLFEVRGEKVVAPRRASAVIAQWQVFF